MNVNCCPEFQILGTYFIVLVLTLELSASEIGSVRGRAYQLLYWQMADIEQFSISGVSISLSILWHFTVNM